MGFDYYIFEYLLVCFKGDKPSTYIQIVREGHYYPSYIDWDFMTRESFLKNEQKNYSSKILYDVDHEHNEEGHEEGHEKVHSYSWRIVPERIDDYIDILNTNEIDLNTVKKIVKTYSIEDRF
jgi:hypothetical protein